MDVEAGTSYHTISLRTYGTSTEKNLLTCTAGCTDTIPKPITSFCGTRIRSQHAMARLADGSLSSGL